MADKTKLILKTGLFDENPDLEQAIGANQSIDLRTLEGDDDWDQAVEAILDCDLIISL